MKLALLPIRRNRRKPDCNKKIAILRSLFSLAPRQRSYGIFFLSEKRLLFLLGSKERKIVLYFSFPDP